MLIMSLITLSFALLISTVLAAPHPAPNPQYGLVPAAPSTLSPSITAMPTTPTSLPNSTLLPSSNSTSSLPQPTTPSLAPNRQAGVYICNDANWAGKCTYYTSSIGAAPEDCTVLDGSASSIGPDEGFTCWFYTNAYCRPLASDAGDFISLRYPGTANLGFTQKGNFNDKIHSYQCFETVAGDGGVEA